MGMQDKELNKIIASGVSPYSLLNMLMIASAKERAKLTSEQKAEREEQRRLYAEQRLRQAQITENICPDCEGKLSRGKKDKKNGYKRLWTCKDCGNSHSM